VKQHFKSLYIIFFSKKKSKEKKLKNIYKRMKIRKKKTSIYRLSIEYVINILSVNNKK
jgi:hypothetical protein